MLSITLDELVAGEIVLQLGARQEYFNNKITQAISENRYQDAFDARQVVARLDDAVNTLIKAGAVLPR